MLDASTSGRAAPKTKTINVEANLMAERLSEREKLFEKARRRLLLIGGVCLLAACFLPSLYRLEATAVRKAADAMAKVKLSAAGLSEAKQQQEAVQPRLADDEMQKTLRKQAELFTGHLLIVLNAASPDLAISTSRLEVVGGDLKLSCKADSETFSAAQTFVLEAGGGPGVQDSILVSTRRSDLLKQGGVSFEFMKKVKVGE